MGACRGKVGLLLEPSGYKRAPTAAVSFSFVRISSRMSFFDDFFTLTANNSAFTARAIVRGAGPPRIDWRVLQHEGRAFAPSPTIFFTPCFSAN